MNLQGHRIVFVGITSRFGLATAQAAAREGAQIVIASERREDVDRMLAQLPASSQGYVLDVSDETQVSEFFDRVGAFDHLVFIAGEALHLGDLKSNAIGQAKQFFELRFWNAFVIAKYGSASIRPGGSIILSNGIAGRRPWKGWAVAASIAGAVESLTRALAIELAPIRVNALCTGASDTGFGDPTPMTYREVLHDDIARAVLLTAADDTGDASEAYLYLMREKFSTGRTILVDAGAALV